MQSEEIRAAIEGQLRKQQEAVPRKDIESYLGAYDSEYVYTDEDGQESGLAEIRHWQQKVSRVTTWRTEKIAIRDFSFDGEQAPLRQSPFGAA